MLHIFYLFLRDSLCIYYRYVDYQPFAGYEWNARTMGHFQQADGK